MDFPPNLRPEPHIWPAFVGAVLHLRGMPGETIGARWFNVATGFGAAYFLTPIVVDFFALNERAYGGFAFLLGLFSVNVIATARELIGQVTWDRVRDVLPWGRK